MQIMATIRKKLVDGDNYDDIIAYLGGMVSERTFYRYLKSIWDHDIKALEKTTSEAMMSEVAAHLRRSKGLLKKLNAIADDHTISAEYRIEAIRDAHKLSNAMIETITSAPAASINVRRKLQALEKGVSSTSPYSSSSSNYQYLPPAVTPEQLQQYYQEQVRQEEQREQQGQVEVVRASATEEEQYQRNADQPEQQQQQQPYGTTTPRRDWWNV